MDITATNFASQHRATLSRNYVLALCVADEAAQSTWMTTLMEAKQISNQQADDARESLIVLSAVATLSLSRSYVLIYSGFKFSTLKIGLKWWRKGGS